jgi:hypothetical protein
MWAGFFILLLLVIIYVFISQYVRILVNSLIIEAKQSTYQVMSWEVGSQKLTEVYKKSFGFLETYTRGENNKF